MKDLTCLNDIIRDNLAIYIDISDIKSWNLNSDLSAVSLTSYKNPITQDLTILDAGLTEYDNGKLNDLENSQYIDQTEKRFKVFRVGFNTGGTDDIQYNINNIYTGSTTTGYTYGNIITGYTSGTTIITGQTTYSNVITGQTVNIPVITGGTDYSGQTGYTGTTGITFITGYTTGITISTGFTTGYTIQYTLITGYTTGYTYFTGFTSGYTYIPTYDIKPVINNSVGNYFNLNGGYLEGFFQLEGYNYQIIPHRFIDGITIETIIYLTSDTYHNITGSTDGFFYYMGIRAEDKYASLFSGDTSYLTSEGHTLDHNGNPFDFTYNLLYKENKRLKIIENLHTTPNNDVLTLKYSFIKESVKIKYKNISLVNGIDFVVTPNNHICLFKLIPCTDFVEITYMTESIDNLNQIYLKDFCVQQQTLEKNIYSNVIGFRISEDKKLGYRYLDDNGDIVEEYSNRQISTTGWTQFDIVFRPYEKIEDPDLLDCFHRREGDLIIYLNGREFTRFKKFKEFYFYGLDTQREKQVGVPYSIAWGGGSFGLKHSYHFNPHFERDNTNLISNDGTLITIDNTDYPYVLTGSTGIGITGITTGFTNTIGIGITGTTMIITGTTGTTGSTGYTIVNLSGITGTTGYTFANLSGVTGTTGYTRLPNGITFNKVMIPIIGISGSTGFTGTTGYTINISGTTTGFTTTIQLPISGLTFLPEKKYQFEIDLNDYEGLFSTYTGNLIFSLIDPVLGETNYQIAENNIYNSRVSGETKLTFRIETPYWITGLSETLLFSLTYDPILISLPFPHYVPVIKNYHFSILNIKLFKYDFIEDKYVKDPTKDNLTIQKNYDGSLHAGIQKLRVYTSVLNPAEIKHNYDIDFPTHNAIIQPFQMTTLNSPVLITDIHIYINDVTSYVLSKSNVQYILSISNNGLELADGYDFKYNTITNSIDFLSVTSLATDDFIMIKYYSSEGQILQGGYLDRNSSVGNKSGRIIYV